MKVYTFVMYTHNGCQAQVKLIERCETDAQRNARAIMEGCPDVFDRDEGLTLICEEDYIG